MDRDVITSIDEILQGVNDSVPVCIKDDSGFYCYANEAWGELAEAPPHKIVGRRDDQLPWGPSNNRFIQRIDAVARERMHFNSRDRRPHFQGRFWLCATIEKAYVPGEGLLATLVRATGDDDFCRQASRVTERGLEFNGLSLSIKQLYLAHQLLFQVPHKQTARELRCSLSRVNQCLAEVREIFGVDDSKELICALSAHGLFPLLEHFELLFRHDWISTELERG